MDHETSLIIAAYFIYLACTGTAKTTKHVQALMNLGKIFLIQKPYENYFKKKNQSV